MSKAEEITALKQKLAKVSQELTDDEKNELERLKKEAENAAKLYETAQIALETCTEKIRYKAAMEAHRKTSDIQDEWLFKVMLLERELKSKDNKYKHLGMFSGREKRKLMEEMEALYEELQPVKEKAEALERELAARHEEMEHANAELDRKWRETCALGGDAETAKNAVKAYMAKIIGQKENEIIKEIYGLCGIDDIDIGSEIKLGMYEQNKGVEPIEWQVLAMEADRYLVISKYVLECKEYNSFGDERDYDEDEEDDEDTEKINVTWENCDLRKWLNEDFIDAAFSEDEKKKICLTRNITDKNTDNYFNDECETLDKVFLLSTKEVEDYFPTDESRVAEPTLYAKNKGLFGDKSDIKEGRFAAYWILRSIISGNNYKTGIDFVDEDGYLDGDGRPVTYDEGIRPAMWLKVEG